MKVTMKMPINSRSNVYCWLALFVEKTGGLLLNNGSREWIRRTAPWQDRKRDKRTVPASRPCYVASEMR
jgi:hypothetical protein